MNKRPGHVVVTTEVGVCSFCGRPRTLRTEEHQLGSLVRTIVTCETCHRTLSSSIGVAGAETEAIEPELVPEKSAAPPDAVAAKREAKPAARAAAKPAEKTKSKTKTTASKAAPSKSGVRKKAR